MELKRPWWTVPEHFAFRLEFYIEEDQEELILGHLAADLLRLGAHSQTFIQLEKGFAATGLIRVLLMASLESRQWLFLMVWSVGSWDLESRDRSLEPLQLVQSQPLTTRDLAAAPAVLLDPRGLFPSHRGGDSVSLRPSQACR